MFLLSGIVTAIVELFKAGHRDDFMSRVDLVFEPILKSESKNKFINHSTILKKNKVQLAQRIGLIYLKPRVCKWRYQKGSRSLMANLTGKVEATGGAGAEDEDEEMDEGDIDFERLEFIIDFLLESLKDQDTVVRWTAAKGIGRITGRLTQDFAD